MARTSLSVWFVFIGRDMIRPTGMINRWSSGTISLNVQIPEQSQTLTLENHGASHLAGRARSSCVHRWPPGATMPHRSNGNCRV
jgi:hypothetical protein